MSSYDQHLIDVAKEFLLAMACFRKSKRYHCFYDYATRTCYWVTWKELRELGRRLQDRTKTATEIYSLWCAEVHSGKECSHHVAKSRQI